MKTSWSVCSLDRLPEVVDLNTPLGQKTTNVDIWGTNRAVLESPSVAHLSQTPQATSAPTRGLVYLCFSRQTSRRRPLWPGSSAASSSTALQQWGGSASSTAASCAVHCTAALRARAVVSLSEGVLSHCVAPRIDFRGLGVGTHNQRRETQTRRERERERDRER